MPCGIHCSTVAALCCRTMTLPHLKYKPHDTPMNKNIHDEFAYQSRELGAQIEDTLGDPPDRKNYARSSSRCSANTPKARKSTM